MQRLTAIALALVLASASGTALADRGKHDKHGKHGGDRHAYSHHHSKHHGGPKYKVYVGYAPRHHHHYGHRYYRPSYYPLGAALVGAAVSYSVYHTHNGVRCYDDHSYRSSTPVSSSQVVGCYRIERFPDGSERRVDLPMSECY
ncbi:hypothetical protein [Mangrovimicrobium sediminis]|uniref:hypothetical protein n=1 Tax=Mangrovimicrobium sediminis TaxID=2562682 RepID=UPI001981E7B7|nr:hypothetical protein [Haliea sp. SAOS-164]